MEKANGHGYDCPFWYLKGWMYLLVLYVLRQCLSPIIEDSNVIATGTYCAYINLLRVILEHMSLKYSLYSLRFLW